MTKEEFYSALRFVKLYPLLRELGLSYTEQHGIVYRRSMQQLDEKDLRTIAKAIRRVGLDEAICLMLHLLRPDPISLELKQLLEQLREASDADGEEG